VPDPAVRTELTGRSILVAVSLLRSGLDALAARHARTVLTEFPPSEWLSTIALRLWPHPSDRQRNVDWARARADESLRLAEAAGHGLLTCLDPGYPESLRAIADPPVVLWTQGKQSLLRESAVAVVGSREATPTSIAVARALARDLAEAGVVVVSGMARGVDSAAHAGALECGGRTIAVVGSGLNHVYPRRNTALAERIRATGAIVSELPANALPLPPHFPLRNRIISGLSLATVVVEAGERSGSLITARQAMEQGRDVLAVPGGTLSGRHRGCHSLIKDGARLVETVEDVLDEIDWSRRQAREAENSPNRLQLSDLESNMAKGELYSVDNLAERTGRSASDLLAELCLLELSGRVTRAAGGQFVRMNGPERVARK
jgi:DNA processing protein